jgi:hypothetical protein
VPLYQCGYRTDHNSYGPGGDAECLRRQLAASQAEGERLEAIVELCRDGDPRLVDGAEEQVVKMIRKQAAEAKGAKP